MPSYLGLVWAGLLLLSSCCCSPIWVSVASASPPSGGVRGLSSAQPGEAAVLSALGGG